VSGLHSVSATYHLRLLLLSACDCYYLCVGVYCCGLLSILFMLVLVVWVDFALSGDAQSFVFFFNTRLPLKECGAAARADVH